MKHNAFQGVVMKVIPDLIGMKDRSGGVAILWKLAFLARGNGDGKDDEKEKWLFHRDEFFAKIGNQRKNCNFAVVKISCYEKTIPYHFA